MLQVHNTLFPDHKMSLEELRWEYKTWDHDKYFLLTLVARNAAGVPVGYGDCYHFPREYHPRKFHLDLMVHPKWRRRGIGSALYDRFLDVLMEHEPLQIRSSAKEDIEEGMRFLQRRGFVENRRTWESYLDLSEFDVSMFEAHLEPPQGIEISSVAMEMGRPGWEKELYELHDELMGEVPRIGDYTPVSFKEFKKWNLGSPGHIPEGYFIAKDGDAYVGECVLEQQTGLEGTLTHGLTGVRQGYRRRGIAMSMKLKALQWAKEQGYKVVRTWNDSANRGMLVINERLGFRKEPEWVAFVKELGRE